MLAVLKSILSKIKSSINYLLSQKFWTAVAIIIIGLGAGLVLLDLLEYLKYILNFLDRLIKSLWNILSEFDIGEHIKFWSGIMIVVLGMVGCVVFKPKPQVKRRSKIFSLSIGIIGLGGGLVFAELLPEILNKPDSPSAQIDSSSAQIDSPSNKKAIFWLGIAIVGAGLGLLGIARGRGSADRTSRTVAIVGVVVAIAGIILGKDDNLVDSVNKIGKIALKIDTLNLGIDSLVKRTSGLDSLVKRTSGLDSLVKRTSSIDSKLEKIFGLDTTLQGLVRHSLKNDSTLQGLVRHSLKNDSTLQGLVRHSLKNDSTLQGLVRHSLKNDSTLEKNLQDIKNYLSEQAQDSVRLLIGTEEKLQKAGFFKTSRFLLVGRKSYELVLSADDSLVVKVPTNKAFILEEYVQKLGEEAARKLGLVDSSGQFGQVELHKLVYHSGELKSYYYEIKRNNNETSITFTRQFLDGMDILAVVKIKE